MGGVGSVSSATPRRSSRPVIPRMRSTPTRPIRGSSVIAPPSRPSRLHPDFFQVELPLDVPEHVVVDGAPVAHQEDGLPLGVDHRAPDLSVLDELLLGLALRLLGQLLDVLRPMAV